MSTPYYSVTVLVDDHHGYLSGASMHAVRKAIFQKIEREVLKGCEEGSSQFYAYVRAEGVFVLAIAHWKLRHAYLSLSAAAAQEEGTTFRCIEVYVEESPVEE